jgi:MbtH protein
MNSDIDYKILINDEGQYSIWPEMKTPPAGWRETGPVGAKQEVLDWIGEKWTDMRPASLRESAAE